MKKEDVVPGAKVRVSLDATVSHLSREISNCVWVKTEHEYSLRVSLDDCDVILPKFEYRDVVEWEDNGLTIQGRVAKWEDNSILKYNNHLCVATIVGCVDVIASKCKIVRKS